VPTTTAHMLNRRFRSSISWWLTTAMKATMATTMLATAAKRAGIMTSSLGSRTDRTWPTVCRLILDSGTALGASPTSR
jgi:lambda repressor-like predicted transcriptional regulator